MMHKFCYKEDAYFEVLNLLDVCQDFQLFSGNLSFSAMAGDDIGFTLTVLLAITLAEVHNGVIVYN